MLSALIQKLESFEPLPEEAKARLRRLPVHRMNFAPHENMVRDGEPRGDVRILAEGVAARTKALDGGGGQAILGFLLPGEVDEADDFVERLDHNICAISACAVAMVPRPAFDQLLADHPEVARGFRRMARLEEAIRRVWLANMGQRLADAQAAHLFCELCVRFAGAGMGGADWFVNPLTQEHLGNVLGISTVHMNRVIQHLKELDLIRLEGHIVRFPSPAKIQHYASFDGGYLGSAVRLHAFER